VTLKFDQFAPMLASSFELCL